jgi:hypothetical protein
MRTEYGVLGSVNAIRDVVLVAIAIIVRPLVAFVLTACTHGNGRKRA